MNAIYKVIWNDAIRQYQVVNELCRSRRKACSVKAVHTDGAGRSLKRSVLATAAATLIGSAAILGVPGSVWADDFNLGDYAPDIEINIGTGAVNNGEPPKVDFSLLPGSNETIYINQSAFTGFASNIFNQEERTPPLYLLETTDSGAMVSDINLSILGADGQPLDLTNNHLGTTGTADFYYTFDNTRIVDGFLYVYRTLNRIDLTSQAGYGQVFDVSDSKGADLKAAITGEGNITFSYNSTGEGGDPGHLTLSNPDNANAYTGRTFVGYNSQGDESSPVNIYFGKDGALGSTIGTEQLQIAAQSAVHFGGENDNEAYTQTVRGLSGSGLLHLGTQATLTLNQSSSDTGLVPDGAGQIIISNRYAGSGTYNAANGSYSGSVFNVNLSDEVAGYELVFTDTASDYTGLINLTNAAVTAYDKDRTVKDDETGTEYTPNALLESATLQLQSGSHLKVTDKGSVHNLIIADENTSIVFDNLDLGTGILEIDNLSLQNTGKVEIDNIGSGLQGAADELGYLEADGGITQEIIRVSGTIVGDRNDMVLAGDALQEKQTELSTDDVEADLYWNFDPNLIFNDKDKTYSAKYGLTKVNVESGQFVLEAKEGATEATADFTAQITGSGGLRIDASGTTVTLGNTEQGAPANSYSGATTVTSGTDVILAVDNAMGNTSSLDADGNVNLDENVDQTIKGLTGSGMLTLEDGSVLTLAQSGDAILDNVLSGNGTFRVSGTGTDKTNVVFNKEFGYDGAFDFSNTVFDLDEGHNRDAAASADFNLSNSVLHLGESGGTFGNMVVNDGVQFDSTYLVIGSDTAALAGTGSLTFNSNTNIKLEGISVADDIALIDFDENTRYQDFITASRGITGSGNVTLQGQNLASFTGSYTQNGTKVANTTWVVSSDLQKNGSDSLQAGALLTGIELTGGELVISGAGTLAALVTQADDEQNAAIRFSLADGALSSSMTVSNTNDFTAAVSVDGGVKLSLAANNALGTTSGLTVAGTAEVALNNGVSQTVGGLEGTGAVLLGSGSDFTLSQNGAASLETAVTGGANSTFTVNLGNSNNALTFENQTGYNGKFVLQDAHLQFADNSNAEAVLGGSNFVLDDGAVFDLQSGTAGTLSGLVFDGGTLGTHQTTLADAGNAQLNVSGDISLDESSKIEAGGITLTGASDVLRADNAGGVRQVFIQYTGEFNSGNGAQLSIDGDALASSDIFNEGDPDTVVAHGTWSGSVGVDEAGKEIYGNLQLTQIDLIGSGDGLILNAAEASDSTLSALVTGSGNLTLAGDLTISGSAPNTYTGETAVTSGTVKLGMDSGFGNTSKLEIWSNAAVDFGAHSQTVGSLEIGNTQLGTTDALRGTGTLTLADGGTSEIWGSNNYSGTIVLGSGHDLAINNASGIGASAKVGFSAADSVLTIEGAKSGTFETELSGAGTVVVSDSTIAAAGGNTNFKGKWELQSDAGVTVSDNVDAVLGTGADIALDGTLTLGFASNAASEVTIDETLSGSGSLVLTGNNNQKFGLASNDLNFAGTVTLDKIGMTVGGSGTGTNNANVFTTADLVLQGGSVLEVATGSTVTTFDKVSVNNGQTAGFKFGGLGFNSDGTTATGTSALVINELVNNGAAQITLDALGTNGDLLGAVAETSLVNGGVDVFQALIQTGKVMDESILNNFTLTGVGTGQATQEIKSATGQVATGYYDFDLALGDSGTDLGVSYDLTRIDISGDKTLTLYEEGTLDAQLTSESGSGNLTIAAGGKIILANDSANALNSYTGVTNVLGTLTAHAGNLGSTSELQIGAGGHYVNAGDNKVGLLDADGTLELSEGYTLEITQGADKISNIAGTLTGGGDLSFAAGELTVSGSSSSNYDGTVYVGSANSKAVLTISGAGALGTGSIVLGTHSGSAVNIYGTEGQTFVNEISGSGTINVDLSGGAFAFGTEQLGLSTGSTLVLDGATFDLISSDVNFNDDVAGKLAIELTDGSKLINDGSADKDVYSLTLNGGTIDLGEINTEFGQINLVSEEGTLNIINKTTIDIASQSDDNVTESGDRTITDGSELLTGGVFYLDIFTGVKNLNGIENLVLEQGFSGTTEKLLQDADPDSEGLELVANMTRDDGTFEYDGSKVYLEYRFKEIELLREELNQGLLVDAEQKPGGTLSAKITGDGNLKLDGTLNLGTAGTVNDYTGRTYVLGDGVVTIQADSAFGQTKDLDIATGGVVKLNGFDQTVGALSGTGKLEFASGSDFKLDNYLDKEGAQSIDINNELVGAAGSTFTIDGTYGTGENDHASVSFGRENNLGGMTFTLRNAKFDIGGTGDFDYLTSRSANDFVLSTGAAVTVNGTSGNLYDYNELSFAGGSLDVTNVTLVKEGTGASTAAVIETNKLDLNGNGTLSVAAKIDSSFDVLADDQANFVSTLIKYGELDGNKSNLKPSTTFSSSAIEQGGTNVAYVNWDGDITVDESAKTVGMSYRVAAIQLADETGDGLKLSTGNTAGVDAALDALVTDYGTHAGNITFDGGRITIGSGTVDEKANTYTGTTNVRSNSTVTLAKDGAFGRTDLLNISNGQVNFNDKSETLGSIAVGSSGSITGAGSVTLGIAGYDETSSTILGEHSSFTADVTLANGHTLTLNDTIGIGSSGTIKLESGTNLVINDELGGNFTKTVSGADNANIELSGKGIGIYADNSNYLGDWTLTNGTTASVSGSDTVGVDSILGRGGTVALGTDATLALSQDSGSIVVDNVFAGAGTLVVSGTSEQEFGFSTNWTDAETSGFTGTLSLEDGIKMTVGGGSGSGSYNATNLTNADFKLGSGSTLVVAKQGSIVDTFDVLNVSGGMLSFGGTFGLGASTSELGQLQVGSLSGSGDIALSIPSGGQAVAQTIDQNNLINIDAAGDDLFQALVTVESGTASADRWTLNGSEMTSGSGLRQAVNGDDSTTTVAYAKYDYQLTTGDVSGVGSGTDNALGIGYDLTAVDIVSGQTLTLSTSGSLGAIIENSSGHGNLAITGQIVLTSENTYSGETRVSGENAKLTVGVSGLGETSVLKLSSSAEFVNSGANAVGYLTASDADMTLDAALTVKGTSGSTIDGGTLNGTGALNLVIGGLTVTDNVGGNYSGLITLGDSGKDTNAELTLSGTAGLGTGMVAFATSNSKVAVNGSASTTLANTYGGNGVIDVDLGASDSVFAFNGAQGTDSAVFTGELRLSNATYNLYAEGEKLAGATLTTENNAVININTTDSVGDRNIGSLHLNGGQINFGELAFGSDSGQIVISKTGDFGIRTDGSESNTVINVSLADNTEASAESVFDANADKSILLIQDFDAQRANLTGLSLGNSKTLTQDVIQTGRGADNDQTAVLTYASGALTGTEQGIEAGWKLTQIELTDASGKGMLINASGESGGSGSISALISGAGNIEFGGGTIKLDHANTYEGQTTVSNNATLELGQSEALGNTSLLNITSGTVAVNATQQTIGSLQTTVEGAITMVRGGRLELAGNSSVSGANSGIESGSTIALATGSETLTINDAESLGLADISLGNGTTLLLSGIASGSSAATFDNAVSGASGTVALNGGALVEFTSTANGFGTLHVYGKGTTAVVNDMQENVTALGNALVNVDSGSRAELNGSDDWTLDNALAIAEGGELALSAGGSGNAFNFSGSNQTINGRVTLTDLMLTLDGHNEEVLDTASVVAGSNSHIHVAKGANASDLQQVKDFTLSSGAEITFDGRLGMSGVGADVLGQLDVDGTLTLESGSTVHVNLDPYTGSSSSVAQEKLVGTAASGSFQDLITAGLISGSAVLDDGTVSGIALTDSNGTPLQTVTADIKNGNETVAIGTFGSNLLISGNSFGVFYGLQAIDIVGDLTISESGSFSAKISSTGVTGSLTVSAGENLTLTGENDYKVATTVTGILTAEEKALGNTESLTISNGGQFTNAGANEVGYLESSGQMTLNALLTVTNAKDSESHVSGTLSGSGGLTIESGSLVSTVERDSASGYSGTVTLGTSGTDAHLTLEATAGAQIGSGTIEFANADSSLTINTSGASVLGNLLSGVGQVTVSGTNGESFAFKAGQEKSVFTGALTLTNVEYDFTTDANDILDDVSLTVNNGTTLVLNDADDTATRKIKGLSLNGGRIDFGTIGNGSGHIDLQGLSLLTSDVDTTLSLETDLADRQDASGSAAFDTVIDDSVLLIGNIAAATPESVLDGLAFADNGQAFTRDLTQGTETTARIHGKLGGLVLAGNDDGTKNIEAGLVNESLELLTTYNVRDSGSITLKIFGSGSLAVYNELKLTNGANSYKGDTTVFGAGAVLTLGADGALGQADSHTGELSVTDGAKVDFGSTSQTIGSITAEGTDALVSADQTNGKLTIADGGTVSGVNSGFHTAVELSDGSAGLTLTNVDALGQASITTLGSNTDLVLSGADGEFDNIVAGSGGLSIVNGANVTLTGENTFAGALTVDSDSSVAASGDVFLHIVGGSLELEGSADFTQTTFADEHSVWKWNRTVNGSGNLSLSTDGAHELVLDSGLADFSGSLTLGNLEMTLSSGGSGMQSLTALSSSKIKSLILDTGADLHLEGATTLSTGVDNFGVTMKSGGSFVFEGIAVPGSEETATNTTHLTIKGNLTLESGFELSLSTEEDAKVDPTNGKSLLEQDDDGMSISVITADDIALDGFTDINKGGRVTLDGGRDTTFEIVDRDGNVVADGHYAFEIGLTDETDSDTLNLSYKLDQVSIRGGQELELAGGNDGSAVENTLSAKLTGSGNLSITSGVVTLANSNNDFTGATTVQSEAVLYAESGALGSDSGAATSILTVEEKASAYIEGNNTVDGLMVSRGEGEETTGVLHIGASDDNVTLTLRSSTSETDPANHIYGTLSGAGTLRVLGNGQVDEGVDPDLTIHSSQERFDGDVQLESGAWVKIDADKSNLFGNSLVHTKISIDKGSLLTIESRYDGEGSFAGIFTNGANDLGGTVEIKLLNASDLFRFTTDQDTAHFNGTFVLDQGTIDYTRLYSSASGGNNAVLADATLQLNDNGNLKLFDADETGNGSTSDVNLGGLTLDGGNIAFGSINYDAGHESAVSGAHAMHINLGGDGVLALNSVGEGEVGRTSTVTILQNETNNISAGGSELLAADDGTSIVLIHNIGSLEINGKNVTGEYANGASIGSDYLQLQNEAGETQLLAQQLGGSGDYVDVAEVVRTFDNELTFGQSTINGENGKYAVSLGYTVDRVGLLHQTGTVSADDFTDETVDNSLWQGLTITASDSEDPKRNEFSALITDGSNGEAGNLVLRGNETARDAVLTITGPENDAGEFTGNTYTGKTWVTAGANIALGANSAFGSTQALRVDSGSTVDFGIYDQTVGGLFALGDEALQSDEGSLITVKEDAVIRGSNTNLFGNITFEGDAEINNAVGLGTGTVTLAGNGSQLEISGASGAAGGEFVNTLVGGENTSVQMSGSDIALGTDQLENYEGSFNLIESELDLSIKPAESDETVLGNVITTDVDSTLSASLGDGTKNFIFAEGSKIAGALAISNGAFNLSDERNLSALDKTDLVIGGAGRLEIASDIGAENVDNLTLNTGSIIAFSGGGTPGSAGYDDSKGHLDLGDGTLTVNGNVGVEVDVGMVNADLVEDAMHDVSNLPLTAQDVLTADQGGQILANLVEAGNVVNDEGAFTLTVTGGVYDSTNSRLEVGIFNDGSSVKVAKGIYDYTVCLTGDGLNLSYGLTGVELIKDQTLSLKGYAETDDIDNTLSIAVTGDGSLSIDAGTITLTGQNGYKGSTTVAGGATLVTGIGGKALGETSSLNLEDSADGLVGARVEIHGDETVGALNIDAKSTLALGAAAENDRTEFTIKNTAGVKSTVHGQIKGGRDSLITVIGNAESSDYDLVVTTANDDFYGDVTLQDAYVRLESINSFGSEGILRLDTTSTLEINSNADDAKTVTGDDGTVYTYHKFENLISGDGTVRVALDDADDYFDFAEDQYVYSSGDDQAFTGTLELAVGKFRFTDRKADVLESVHVKLDGDATLDISSDTSETTDRTMRGLTLAGGTLEFGSLALDREHAEARATHINLDGNDLNLEDADRQVEISFRQNATNYISDAGSEVVNAADGDGSKIVLIHGIGNLHVDGETLATSENAQAVFQDYLKHELADNAEDQILHQSIAGAGQEADVQQVARVDREFGDFGYADMSDQNLGNALYLGYEINSIELLYRGSNDEAYGADGVWKGLTVSTSDLSNQLKAQLTGQGNLVVTGGTGGTLLIGDASTETEYNNYTGRTWVTGNAKVEFAEDNAFGNTSHLRVDVGSSVNLGGDESGGGFSQTVGSLVTYDENALIGGKDASLTVTGSAQIAGNNSGFYGNLIFDTEQVTTGTVTDVEGLGQGNVYIGENYQLQITDIADADGGSILLENDIFDVNGKGGLLQIGSGLSKPEHESTTIIAGNNSNFSGNIRVEDGWAISAEVGEGEDIADRLGTGSLTLAGDASATIDFGSSDVEWNHNVDGRGTLNVATDADKTVSIGSGLGSGFEGTFTVGGGRFELADNADKLGNGNLAASGGNASIIVSDDGPVEFGNNLTITGSNEDRGQLVFEDSIKLSDNGSPELIVDGNLTLKGADVSVSVDGELEAGQGPNEPLDMSSITMADEGSIDYVIAKAGLIDMSDTTLSLETDGSGNAMTVDITDGGKKVATGKYDFGLSVSTDRTELGLSYRLVEVEIDDADTLLGLQGAVSGSTSAADWANASEFSAKITGAGGISLVNGNLTLTGAENTYHGATVVYDGAVLTVESSLGNTSLVTVAEGGRLVNASDSTKAGAVNVAGRLDLEAGSKLSLKEGGESSITGSITGSGNLELLSNASVAVTAGSGYEAFTGSVTMEEGAEYALSALNGSTVIVRNDFADSENSAGGTVRFDKASGSSSANYSLAGSADGFTGTFELGGNVVVSANSIDAIGGEGSELLITTGKVGDESEKATLSFEYDDELVGQNDSLRITQGMTEGITFEKSGDGVVDLSDNAMGAGAVDVKEGGVLFGTSDRKSAYDTALEIAEDAWAAGFGGVSSLKVDLGGSFYVGGRSGYNSVFASTATKAANEDPANTPPAADNTVDFVVNGSVTNAGTIYVGNKNADGSAPADSSSIGNELVIKGDYNVTASDKDGVGTGGIFDMNAIIAGDDSIADHVTITGKINGNGYVDVNYDSTVSTGGTLEYLGLVKVEGGDDGDSLRLKDTIKIGDLWYRLMWSSDQNEYYLQSSVTDPGDKPWDTEDVENVNAGTRSALAFMQAQAFDLSLRGHLGETLYVDPVTGEQRKSSFWMVQRGDWTKFSNASGQLDADGNLYTTHLGTDLFKRETDGATFRWGVLAGFADGDFDVSSNVDGKSSKGSFRGYSAGLYMTAESKAESGPFLGLQLRWNRFDSEVGQDDYDVNGLSLTAEASWDQLLSKGITDGGRNYEWRLEPHVRAYWTNFGDPDDWTSSLGETYSSDFDNGLLVRVGARTKIQTTLGTRPAWQAYAEANWVYNNGDYSTTMSTKYGDVTSTQNGAEFAEFRLGLEAQFTTNVNVWLEGHHQTGSDDYESTGAMFGFKYMW